MLCACAMLEIPLKFKFEGKLHLVSKSGPTHLSYFARYQASMLCDESWQREFGARKENHSRALKLLELPMTPAPPADGELCMTWPGSAGSSRISSVTSLHSEACERRRGPGDTSACGRSRMVHGARSWPCAQHEKACLT